MNSRRPLNIHTTPPELSKTREPREWVQVLAKYRDPATGRSWFEFFVTFVPFVALWVAAWWSMSVSYVLTLAIAVVLSGFILRLFAIQHDCGHGAFFKNRKLNDWLGRVIGIFTLTPYEVWRHAHSIHHSTSGNLGRRGMGDIDTLTVAEYLARSKFDRFKYRLYRNPVVLFGLGPGYMFFLQHRIPLGLMKNARFWFSSMGTNLGILALLSTVYYFGGWAPILLIFVPSTLLAATTGVWLFYVQHQFEDAHWSDDEDWQLHDAAFNGSSHYVLPAPLQWMSANIGIHHVHHLYSRIPFYRLPEVLRDYAELADQNRMTIRESFVNARLHLWDEHSKKLMSFRQALSTYSAA